MTKRELQALLVSQHKEKFQREKKPAKKTPAKKTPAEKKSAREQLTETAREATQSADNFETMPIIQTAKDYISAMQRLRRAFSLDPANSDDREDFTAANEDLFLKQKALIAGLNEQLDFSQQTPQKQDATIKELKSLVEMILRSPLRTVPNLPKALALSFTEPARILQKEIEKYEREFRKTHTDLQRADSDFSRVSKYKANVDRVNVTELQNELKQAEEIRKLTVTLEDRYPYSTENVKFLQRKGIEVQATIETLKGKIQTAQNVITPDTLVRLKRNETFPYNGRMYKVKSKSTRNRGRTTRVKAAPVDGGEEIIFTAAAGFDTVAVEGQTPTQKPAREQLTETAREATQSADNLNEDNADTPAQAFTKLLNEIKIGDGTQGEGTQQTQREFKVELDKILDSAEKGTLSEEKRDELLPIFEDLISVASDRARRVLSQARDQIKGSSEGKNLQLIENPHGVEEVEGFFRDDDAREVENATQQGFNESFDTTNTGRVGMTFVHYTGSVAETIGFSDSYAQILRKIDSGIYGNTTGDLDVAYAITSAKKNLDLLRNSRVFKFLDKDVQRHFNNKTNEEIIREAVTGNIAAVGFGPVAVEGSTPTQKPVREKAAKPTHTPVSAQAKQSTLDYFKGISRDGRREVFKPELLSDDSALREQVRMYGRLDRADIKGILRGTAFSRNEELMGSRRLDYLLEDVLGLTQQRFMGRRFEEYVLPHVLKMRDAEQKTLKLENIGSARVASETNSQSNFFLAYGTLNDTATGQKKKGLYEIRRNAQGEYTSTFIRNDLKPHHVGYILENEAASNGEFTLERRGGIDKQKEAADAGEIFARVLEVIEEKKRRR